MPDGRAALGVVPQMRELVSPLPLAAVAVLAVNDHVLKWRFPGFVTGKLSDLAGCFVLPLFLSALLALATRWSLRTRLRAGTLATVAFFSAIKISAPAADAVAAALGWAGAPLGLGGGPLLADPGDLIALPLAAAAYAFGSACGGRGHPGGEVP